MNRSAELKEEEGWGRETGKRGGVNKSAGHNELNTLEQDKDRQMETAGVSWVCVCVCVGGGGGDLVGDRDPISGGSEQGNWRTMLEEWCGG